MPSRKKARIAMTSITYAMKAKELLRSLGYSCEVERMPKGLGSGCGYSIIIYTDSDVITALLEKRGIPHKGVYPA